MGLVGAGALLPAIGTRAAAGGSALIPGGAAGCVLIPQETEGPYDLDLSGNASMFRQDIREGLGGTRLDLTLVVVNANDNCNPISNARVDIWHCNKDGYYSGFANQPGYLGTKSHIGETFFRGIQLTNALGEARFTTIYPGWYPGRAAHIHFQIFLGSLLRATSQLAFPDELTALVNSTAPYSPHGQNPTTTPRDGVFADGSAYQTCTVVPNDAIGGYDAALTVPIAAPATGVINLAPETGGQFRLFPNYPNPFTTDTVIPFTLMNDARVSLDVFNVSGRKVLVSTAKLLPAGMHRTPFAAGELPGGDYPYQLTVTNDVGTFRQCKLMTITR